MAINSSGKLSRLWGEHRWAILVLTAGLLLRGIAALYLPAGFDEAYYYTYTQHPSPQVSQTGDRPSDTAAITTGRRAIT
ncbi:MAG: hypothetical protein AAGM36_01965, partial [Cyanobacteria bacterium J06597_1]